MMDEKLVFLIMVVMLVWSSGIVAGLTIAEKLFKIKVSANQTTQGECQCKKELPVPEIKGA